MLLLVVVGVLAEGLLADLERAGLEQLALLFGLLHKLQCVELVLLLHQLQHLFLVVFEQVIVVVIAALLLLLLILQGGCLRILSRPLLLLLQAFGGLACFNNNETGFFHDGGRSFHFD